MTTHIRTAMVLAAGLGTRMCPLTIDRPKPMIKVGGKTLIDWVLDDLAESGVKTAVINLHYKADVLARHLSPRQTPIILFSDETEQLLDTGGGVAAALPLFADDVFLVTNSDTLWQHGLTQGLTRLAEGWSGENMDALLLLAAMDRAFGFEGAGDFFLDDDGIPERRGGRAAAPLVYAGTQVVHRRIFNDCPDGPFSFNQLWDKAIQAGRLKAIVHTDNWHHVGTPASVDSTSRALMQGSVSP